MCCEQLSHRRSADGIFFPRLLFDSTVSMVAEVGGAVTECFIKACPSGDISSQEPNIKKTAWKIKHSQEHHHMCRKT